MQHLGMGLVDLFVPAFGVGTLDSLSAMFLRIAVGSASQIYIFGTIMLECLLELAKSTAPFFHCSGD
jgi:hypothetical protein